MPVTLGSACSFSESFRCKNSWCAEKCGLLEFAGFRQIVSTDSCTLTPGSHRRRLEGQGWGEWTLGAQWFWLSAALTVSRVQGHWVVSPIARQVCSVLGPFPSESVTWAVGLAWFRGESRGGTSTGGPCQRRGHWAAEHAGQAAPERSGWDRALTLPLTPHVP